MSSCLQVSDFIKVSDFQVLDFMKSEILIKLFEIWNSQIWEDGHNRSTAVFCGGCWAEGHTRVAWWPISPGPNPHLASGNWPRCSGNRVLRSCATMWTRTASGAMQCFVSEVSGVLPPNGPSHRHDLLQYDASKCILLYVHNLTCSAHCQNNASDFICHYFTFQFS